MSSPYGICITTKDASGFTLAAQQLSDFASLGIGVLHLEVSWQYIEPVETSPATYILTTIDSVVVACNAAGIAVHLVIQNAPAFRQSVSCGGSASWPDPTDTATFAQTLASRYNGVTINPITSAPYGTVVLWTIGGEDYDDNALGTTCRINGATQAALNLIACASAIKQYGAPGCRVGCAALLGDHTSVAHIQQWLTAFFMAGGGPACDFLNIHTYFSGGLAPNIDNTVNGNPAFSDRLNAMHQVAVSFGFPNLRIRITETGYATNTNYGRNPSNIIDTATQATYLTMLMNEAMATGFVEAIYWFTSGPYNQGSAQSDGMSLTQGWLAPNHLTYLPAYSAYQSLIAANPTWQLQMFPPPPLPTIRGRSGKAVIRGRSGKSTLHGGTK